MRSSKVLGIALAIFAVVPLGASAQIAPSVVNDGTTFAPVNNKASTGPGLPFPGDWANAPKYPYKQDIYPYPGQCYADPANATAFQGVIPACTLAIAPSFACDQNNLSAQSAGWRSCGNPKVAAKILNPVDPLTQPKFVHDLLNPNFFAPTTNSKYPGADYYEIAIHEAWGYQSIADVPLQALTPGNAAAFLQNRLFPNPKDAALVDPKGNTWTPTTIGVPNGMQWTGLVCKPTAPATTCTCPAEIDTTLAASYCPGGVIPAGQPLFTPIIGAGQKRAVTTTLSTQGATPVAIAQNAAIPGSLTDVLTGNNPLKAVLFTPPALRPSYSPNDFIATWPAISIRATTGTPVVVKWMNETPNNHLFCPHPEAADWPCGIDRTFMGVKATIDPATTPMANGKMTIPFDKVNQFGGAQQPDNSWVTHLHGGEIPPSTDGFAEKWFGNINSGKVYSPTPWLLSPAFGNPKGSAVGLLYRPGGDPATSGFTGASSWYYDTYAYPMTNKEATIWWHTHTLGKTHHDVIMGPAGFFPVKEPTKHGAVTGGACVGSATSGPCEYSFLDPVTENFDAVGVPEYDLFLAIQDRSFNDDGSLNFPNGMSQAPPAPIAGAPVASGTTPVTPGVLPQIHPTWVPEYFADHIVVNGVLWPKKPVEPGWYRIRMVDGSDARCYTIGFTNVAPVTATAGSPPGVTPVVPATAAVVKKNVPFVMIANEQGYLPRAVPFPGNSNKATAGFNNGSGTWDFTMCPGERYEILVDFSKFAGQSIWMVNTANAPYPNGLSNTVAGSIYAETVQVMRFDVLTTAALPLGAGVPIQSCKATTINAVTGFQTDFSNVVAGLPTRGCMTIPGVSLPPATYTYTALTGNGLIDPDFVSFANLPACGAGVTGNCVAAERQLYLNEKLDNSLGLGQAAAPGVAANTFPISMGLQINGVPFEYDVTETPKKGTIETWHVVNTTVDAHPIHPHLVKAQITKREFYNKGNYLRALCGSTTCQPTGAPGGVLQAIPNVYVQGLNNGATTLVVKNAGGNQTNGVPVWEQGWKDAMKAFPGEVLTFTAKWDGPWNTCTAGTAVGPDGNFAGASPCFEEVTAGPYVWHCHINSHEDSEMMRTSTVLP
jgi:FtsP/CotA-like multicopper oxidase with cupredoxin domain